MSLHPRDVFFVGGRAFSIGNKLSFQDLNGHELAFIRQKLLSWGPTYEITRDGRFLFVSSLPSVDLLNCHGLVHWSSQAMTVSYHRMLFRGLRTQWFSSGKYNNFDGMPRR